MQMLKILAHSYYFPPTANPRSCQVPRLLMTLDAQVAIICGEDPYARQDESIHPHIEEQFAQIRRVPYRRNYWLYRLDNLAHKFSLSWQQLPDRWRQWNLQACKDLLDGQIELDFDPDLLITFGQPMSDHIFGLRYKQETGKPWIAHFSDPWADNPFRRDNPFTAWLNRRVERRVIESADAFIFTSPETVDLVMQKYPADMREKAVYIPHCYDQMAENTGLVPSQEYYTLRSIGNFYGPRSPKPLFEAVEQVAGEMPSLLDNVSIELAGLVYNFDLASYPTAQQFVKHVGVVSYEESHQLMQTAHCLLVVDAPAERSVFFPSKLVEYIGADRFIFAITPPGASARIVGELGGLVADPTDIVGVVRAMKQVLQQKPQKLPVSANHYSQEYVGQQMLKVIESVC